MLFLVNLVGTLALESIPDAVSIQVLRNGKPITENLYLSIENGFQAVSLALPKLAGVPSCAPFPADFVQGAGLTDVWGSFFYGSSSEGRIHHRDYFETTCQRLAEDGFEDVYVANTFRFTQVSPLPKLEVGVHTMGISEEDLSTLVTVAHRYGLRLHLLYFAGTVDGGHSYLATAQHSEEWIRSLFGQYKALMVEQAEMADRCNVDVLVLGWQAAGVNYEGHEDLWYALWADTIKTLRDAWPALLEYNITQYGSLWHFKDGPAEIADFDGIDSFLLSQWAGSAGRPGSYDDSVNSLYDWFSAWLEREVRWFKDLAQRPFVLVASIQSTDGYMVDGWSDVAIGIVKRDIPDFFEQARGYEALFQAMARSDVFDGVVLPKFHWDDPFGPDLGLDSFSRMDLSASIRNKPTEAVVKRWFGGVAGPSYTITREQHDAMNRPWCPPSSAHQIGTLQCSLLMDDFEGSSSFRDAGWSIDSDSAHRQRSDLDPTSYCYLSFAEDGRGNTYLAAEFRHNSWVKTRYWGESVDVSSYDGVELTLWADDMLVVGMELGTRDPVAGWQAGTIRKINIDQTPRRFRLPFSDFKNPTDRVDGILPYLRALVEVNVHVLYGLNRLNAFLEGTLFLDDICFYKE